MSFFEQLCLIDRKITTFHNIAEEYMNVYINVIVVLKHSNVLDISPTNDIKAKSILTSMACYLFESFLCRHT